MRDSWRLDGKLPDRLGSLLDQLLGKDRYRFEELIGAGLPKNFRFNALKHTLDFQVGLLKRQGFTFRPVVEVEQAWQVEEGPYPVGKSFSHFTGHLYLQDLSSMLPPLALGPNPGDRVLDMCASPGSKTTQMAALMGNLGVILANDGSRRRTRTLISNLQRMGVMNTAVATCPGEQLGNLYFELFDRVLLDPPCSALGTLHKSPSVLAWWSPDRSKKLAVIQKNLLQSGLKALKPGGVLVYSTCTITPEENEQVIQYALDRFPVELEMIRTGGLKARPGLTSYQGERFHPALERCVRLYPVDNFAEGFFLARLRKGVSFGASRRPEPTPHSLRFESIESSSELAASIIRVFNRYGIDTDRIRHLAAVGGRQTQVCSQETGCFPFASQVVAAGLPVARVEGPPGLTTEGAQWCGQFASLNCVELASIGELENFLNRDDIQTGQIGRHQVLVRFQGMGIGHGFVSENRLMSRFPRTGADFRFAN